MTNLDSVLKSRDIILLKKVHIVKAFSVVTYGWTVKQAECQRIETFKQWSWRSLLKVPWIARRSNQSILREISSENLVEGPMLKLEFQDFDHLMRIAGSLEKSLRLGKIEDRRRGCQRMRWLDGIANAMDINSLDGEGQGVLVCCSPWVCKESDTTGWLNNNNKCYFE